MKIRSVNPPRGQLEEIRAVRQQTAAGGWTGAKSSRAARHHDWCNTHQEPRWPKTLEAPSYHRHPAADTTRASNHSSRVMCKHRCLLKGPPPPPSSGGLPRQCCGSAGISSRSVLITGGAALAWASHDGEQEGPPSLQTLIYETCSFWNWLWPLPHLQWNGARPACMGFLISWRRPRRSLIGRVLFFFVLRGY